MDAPIAHVTLVAGGRQHYSGSHGLPEEVITPDGLPLSFGFCPTVVATGQPLRRTDLIDSEFRDNPAVAEHGARAYAGTPLRTGDGAVVGSLCVVDRAVRDWPLDRLKLLDELANSVVTELELVAALQEAEDRAEAARVIRHLHEGVVLLDERRVVRVWNPAAEALTGLAASVALGKPIEDSIAEWPPSGAPSALLELRTETGACSIEVNGSEWEGGAVYAVRDVTAERKLARMRDELVATISHELRTPLASIYAAAITLQRPDVRLDAATTTTLLAVVEEQAARLADLCETVLLAGRLDHAAPSVTRERIDLAALVDDVAAQLVVQPERGARLTLDVALDAAASGDREALRRVVVNVVDNALKYSPPSGVVRVVARRLDSDTVELVVEDEGTGIPEAERELVFEKFYRCDPHMRDGVGGTGLGLHIARSLVDGMGGRMYVSEASSSRTGAAVHVELDACP